MVKSRIVAGMIAGLLLSAVPATAAPTITFRVEGQNSTLLPRTEIKLLDALEPNTGCPGNSVAAAIEVGTGGKWDRQTFTSTILGETHAFADNDYWGFSVLRGGRYQAFDAGICDELVSEGEEVLAAYNVADANFDPTIRPLLIEGLPAQTKPGSTLEVSVTEFFCKNQYCGSDADGTQDGYPRPLAGATLRVGDVDVTTNAAGKARITLAGRGKVVLRATGPSHTPSRTEEICVSDGADGFCGSNVPAAGGTPPAPCVTTGADGLCGTRDRRAAEGRILGITDQQAFARGRAPRTLRAAIPADPSGLFGVKLRLTRRFNGRCSYFSGKRETFRRVRCGRGSAFSIGNNAAVSYLLPAALPVGRYVLDVIAIDGAFNRDALARGRNRVVFSVR